MYCMFPTNGPHLQRFNDLAYTGRAPSPLHKSAPLNPSTAAMAAAGGTACYKASVRQARTWVTAFHHVCLIFNG